MKTRHLWRKYYVANSTTSHACCSRCFAERTIEQRPKIKRYRVKTEVTWHARMPECR